MIMITLHACCEVNELKVDRLVGILADWQR